eukprot:gene5851-15887_t
MNIGKTVEDVVQRFPISSKRVNITELGGNAIKLDTNGFEINVTFSSKFSCRKFADTLRSCSECEKENFTIDVGKLQDGERRRWEELFRLYIKFYNRTEPEEMYDHLWKRLMTDGSGVHCFVARDDSGKILGFTHYLVHQTTALRD